MKNGNRWYDKSERLAKLMEGLKGLPDPQLTRIITGVMELIKSTMPDLLEKNVENFPLELFRRRWYDYDPYLWLIFNGLECANDDLHKKVARFLELEIGEQVG